MLHYEKPFKKRIIISETDRIIIKARRVKKKITFLVIVGITMINGKEHQIVRYDLSHGFLHKDLLFEPKGGKERIFEELDVKLAERIIRQTVEDFEIMKRKYLMKTKIRGLWNERN